MAASARTTGGVGAGRAGAARATAVSPEGGQAAFVCTRQNTQINPPRNYRINAGIPATPGAPIVGQITLNGQPFSFSAPG